MKYWNHAFLFAVVLFVYRFLQTRFAFAGLLLLTAFWYWRTKDHSFVLVICILLVTNVSFYQKGQPDCMTGRIQKVSGQSYEVCNKRYRYLLYTNQDLVLDSEIVISGSFTKLEDQYGFFTVNYAAKRRQEGIYYAISSEEIAVRKEGRSVRARLQKRIQRIENETQRALLNRMLLGIYSQSNVNTFLFDYGFSLTGILAFLEMFLQYFLDREMRNPILIGVCIVLCLVYHFPILLMQYLLYHVLEWKNVRTDIRIGITASVILIAYPGSYQNPSFLIPTLYRVWKHFMPNQKMERSLCLFHLQSILFHQINPIAAMLYNTIRPYLGFAWIISFLYVMSGQIVFLHMLNVISNVTNYLSIFVLPGSILGFGLPFYLALLLCFRKSRYRTLQWYVLFFVFFVFGFFHPFAEVTFINVGQGDSILLRAPCNQENILIDTGKPSQYRRLEALLDAKQIHRLSALVITHDDSDHSGNREEIVRKYRPAERIESHHEVWKTKRMTLLDLNRIENDDLNQSSLVELVRMNGLVFLLMGDADEGTEKAILKEYGALHCDVLKLSHHGSKTGTSEDFLNQVRPQFAIVSAGDYSLYHHPSPETVQKLLQRHIPYWNTKEEGDITFISLPFHFNLLITASGKIGIIHP